MFERFSDRARKVMALANQEAQRFNHDYIGTEHILLGLLKEGSGVGAHALKHLGADLRKARLEVDKLVKSGPDMVTMGKLLHTPRCKRLLEFAVEEARGLGHNYIGTEHLLLGLLRETDGLAAQVLSNLGLRLEDVRAEVLNLVGAGSETVSPRFAKAQPAPSPHEVVAWLASRLVEEIERRRDECVRSGESERAEALRMAMEQARVLVKLLRDAAGG